MTLADALDRILSQHPKAIELGLERVRRVADAMGFEATEGGIRIAPTTILVGGTNGKGSTCAMLESILLQSGFKVACYTSPHLLAFNERLRMNGEAIADAPLLAAFEKVAARQSDTRLTFFEYTTLAIFELIRQASVDVAILEIGLGGRLDAVNIADADASVLTSIDLDHQEFLGDTRDRIGWEKAHIARAHRPLICADPQPPASVAQVAQEIGADLWQFGSDFNVQGDRQQWSWAGRGQRRNALAYPALRGANQLLNASATLATLAALSRVIPVTQGAVRTGLALVELPARFQVMPGQPAVVLDVAHNPHAAGVLAANLDQMGFFPKTIAVVGVLAGKDAQEIFRRIGERVDHWCLASLEGPHAQGRARSAKELESALLAALPNAGRSLHASPEQAFSQAKDMAGLNDRIVAFGSFVTIADIYPSRHAR